MQEHHIQAPKEYRHIVANGNDFISVQEIEQADAASLLYQSGYLTIDKVEGYALLGNEIWKALRQGDISEIVRLYNIAIANIA